jgi:hypothetical protein
MRIVTDCHFEIGKTHLICEDYACHGQQPVPYVIVADGCSAAEDVDVGARLMVLHARQALPAFAQAAASTDDGAAWAVQHWQLGRQVAGRSIRQAASLGLSDAAVDVTLLIAFVVGDYVRVHVYGDGCLIGRRQDGSLRVIQIEFAHNAPYYLSYLEDRERQRLYADLMEDQKAPQQVRWIDGQTQTKETRPYDAPGIFAFPLSEFPLVAIATDGLSSFLNVTNRELVDLAASAGEFMKFGNLNGDFVKRRLRRTLNDYAKQHIFNIDDIGCGALATVDSEVTAKL